jgi:hypothetical protein
MAPIDPKRLKVADRFVTVLKAITAGSDYFFTPLEVAKHYIFPEEAACIKDRPVYSIFPEGSGGSFFVETGGVYDEKYPLTVHGIVENPVDTVGDLEKAVRDVRKAVEADSRDESTGALGNLCVNVSIESPPETDGGVFSGLGRSYFAQEFMIHISGDVSKL